MKSIEIISIPVTNQQAAKEFYLKLGFQIMVEAPFQGDSMWIQMSLPGAQTSITLVNWFPQMPAGSMSGMVIKCEDLDREIEKLTASGITVSSADDTPWGRFATVKDPDNNSLSLHGE